MAFVALVQSDVAADGFADFADERGRPAVSQDEIAAEMLVDAALDAVVDVVDSGGDVESFAVVPVVDVNLCQVVPTKQDHELHRMRRKLVNYKRSHCRHLLIIRKVRKKLKDVTKAAANKMGAVEWKSREHANLLYALARNRGHQSQTSTTGWRQLMGGKGPQTRQTISKWEQILGSTVIANMAKFNVQGELMLSLPENSDDTCWTGSIFQVMTDATKSGSFRNETLQGTRVKALYVSAIDGIDGVTEKVCWPDLQTVGPSDALSILNLVHKQLRIVQCPALDREIMVSAVGPGKNTIRSNIFCTDDGSDVASGKNIAGEQYRCDLYVWMLGFKCLAHQQSLGVCKTMSITDAICDDWHTEPYYNVLTKTSHLFRQRHSQMRTSTVNHVGGDPAHPASLHCKKIAPVSYAGRWGAIGTCELYFEEFTEKLVDEAYPDWRPDLDVPEILEAAFADAASKEKSLVPSRGPNDQARLDELRAFAEKRSRWFREAIKGNSQLEFWLLLRMSRRCNSPWQHVLLWMQKKEEADTFAEGRRTKYIELVTRRHGQFKREFNDLLFHTDHTTFWNSEVEKCRVIFPEQYFLGLVSLTGCAAAEYEARFGSAHAWPALLCHLVRNPPSVDCAQRRRYSALLLAVQFMHWDALSDAENEHSEISVLP